MQIPILYRKNDQATLAVILIAIRSHSSISMPASNQACNS